MNYKHLHYFWVVAKAGGIARASERLHLTPQTISGQLRLLEESLGTELHMRAGRGLELTEAGRLVLSYAEEIFSLGGELEQVLRNLPAGRPQPFKVGVADVVPKSIAHRLLAPALQLPETMRIVCREESLQSLLAELAVHRLDLVIADQPIPAGLNIRGFNHRLGGCGVSFFAHKTLVRTLRGEFPQTLNSAPLLLPGEGAATRSGFEQWLEDQQLHPRIAGEFDDSALMKAFGQAGAGIFMAPTVIEDEVQRQYQVKAIGRTEAVREQFFAISVERRLTHPAVVAITDAARQVLFRRSDSSRPRARASHKAQS